MIIHHVFNRNNLVKKNEIFFNIVVMMEDSLLYHNLERTLVKLKVISLCKPKQRLVFKNDTITIHDNTYTTSAIRYITDQSRKDIIEGLKLLFHEVKQLIENFFKQSPIDVKSLDRIKNDISNILNDSTDDDNDETQLNGLNSLLITYQSDQLCVAELTNIIEKYQQLLDNLNERLTD